MIATMNFRLYFLVLLFVVPLCSPLSAQAADEDDHFYLGFAGSAIFPYEPAVPPVVLGGTANFPGSLGGPGNNFKTGAGFTAAFGYAFKEGFSTEMEWGYQKIKTDNPTQNLSLSFPSRGFLDFEGFESPPISITIENSGEIKTWSLMGNVYYRYPKWRVSPYAGFGLGAFFHDRTATSIAAIENLPRSPFVYLGAPIFGSISSDSPPEPLKTTPMPGLAWEPSSTIERPPPSPPLRTYLAPHLSTLALPFSGRFPPILPPNPSRPQPHTRIPGLPIRSWQVSLPGSPSSWSSDLVIVSAQVGGSISPIDADQIEAGIRLRF